jgi:hypothetical protein
MNAVLRALGSFHTGRHSQPASGKASAQSQDKARTVVVLGIEAAAGTIKNIGPVAVLACSPCQLANAALSCGWLALRAGVLRRAVSSWVRPLLHRGTCSVSVGRMPLRSSPWAKAPSSCAVVLPARLAIAVQVGSRPQMRPNRSLNRTHCGMRPKARHFILGF